jgi:hypothetical protein
LWAVGQLTIFIQHGQDRVQIIVERLEFLFADRTSLEKNKMHLMKSNLSIVVFFYEKFRYRSAFIGFEGQTNTFPYVDHIFDKTIHHLDGVMGCRRNA